MNILIIGAGGFIGSNLSEEILERKKEWNITAIDISDAKISHLLNKDKFNFIKEILNIGDNFNLRSSCLVSLSYKKDKFNFLIFDL